MPFFSVVIPTYNSEELLNRCLTSVFSQTYQDFEIIVVDNSSTDGTQKVLKSFADQKLKVITVNNNGIIAHSRNKGIKNAKGKWIAFLDSDDVWKPEKLEKVRDAVKHNPEVILVCHDEWQAVNGEITKRLRYGPRGRDLYERLLLKGNCLSTSAVSICKDIANNIEGFSERNDFVTAEDYEYWIRLAQVGDFYFINEVLGEYHIHNDNQSRNVKIHADAVISVKEYHFDLWQQKFLHKRNAVKHARGRMWAGVGASFMKVNKFNDALNCSRKAIGFSLFYWKAWAVFIIAFININIKRRV